MPIINKGIFNINSAYLRDVGNDWPTAQVTTTSDVIESASNLYFTTDRVNATVQPFLTTANVIETSGNLYFTTDRVNATVQPFLTTANVIESASNLYFTNTRVVSALIAGDNISIESNGRISANITAAINDIANISLTIDNLTTDGITEGTVNLYYTNTRVVSALIAGENITIESNGRISANVQQTPAASLNLTTADVRETSNLYFTNSRVVSAVVPLLTTANVIETSSNLYFTTDRVNATVQPFLTTANVIESSANLYFTNTRSREAISGSTGVIYDSSTGAISIGQNVDTTASVTFKDVFVSNNLVVYGSTTTWGANNLVVSDNMIYLNNNSNTSNPDLGISFNYYDGVYHHAGFFRDASDGIFKVFDNYEPEPDANIFIDTDHNTFRLANLQATNYIGNVTGFVTGQVSSLGNHTTSNLTEGTNQYFTNARVVSALIAGDNITIEANGRISANVAAVPVAAQVSSLSNFTTADLIENSANLYFTNTRARSAFSAGSGITISTGGKISSTFTTEIFNGLIDGGKDYTVTSGMSGITFASNTAGDRFLLRSLHVTNISDNTAYISANVLYATSNTAYLANLIPVPVGSVVEFMNKPQIMQPGDKINLQGFDQSLTPTSNILHSYFTYQSINNDITYVGVGQTLATSNTNILVATADQSALVFESIKFVNLQSYSIPVKVYFGSANAAPKSYLAYNMQVPPNSSVEVLQSPKILNFLDTVYASYSNAPSNSVAIFLSYKITAATSLYTTTTASTPGGAILGSFSTTYPDGTILYYTLE